MSAPNLFRVLALFVLAVGLALAAAFVRPGNDPMRNNGFFLAGLVAALAVAFVVRAPPGFLRTLRILGIGAFVAVAFRTFVAVAGPAILNPGAPFALVGIFVGAVFASVPLAVAIVLAVLTRPARVAERGPGPASSRRRWLVAAALSGAALLGTVGVGELHRDAGRRARVDAQLAFWSREPAAHAHHRSWGDSEGEVVGAAFAPDGRLLATVGLGIVSPTTVKLWDLSRADGDEEIATARFAASASLASITFARGEGEATSSLLLRFTDGRGLRFSVPGLIPLEAPSPSAPTPPRTSVQRRWTSGNGQVVDWSNDGTLTFSAADEQVLARAALRPTQLRGLAGPGVAFSGDGAEVAAALEGEVLHLSSKGQAQSLRGPSNAQVVAWSADASELFVGGGASGWIVDPAGRAPARKLRSRKLEQLAAFRASLDR
jgi:hypothetical protein